MGYINVSKSTVIYVMFEQWISKNCDRKKVSYKFRVWPAKDVESSMLGPLSQSFVCDLININWKLNCMVEKSEDLNSKS